MNLPLVSVIVPVFNSEKYLRKCLDSLMNQLLKDIEIIIVDDGSTDDSNKIAKEFFNKDNRFRLITQENSGVSAARNKGLSQAKGEYIGFVDSDDWVHVNMYKELFNNAVAHSACISICGYKLVHERTEKVEVCEEPDIQNIDMTRERSQIINEYLIDTGYLAYSACNKIYKRDLLLSSNINFIDMVINLSEDFFFVLRALLAAKKIVSTTLEYYQYYQRKGSLSHRFKIKMNESCICLAERTKELLNNLDLLPAVNEGFMTLLYKNKIKCLLNILELPGKILEKYSQFRNTYKNLFSEYKLEKYKIAVRGKNQKILNYVFKIKLTVLFFLALGVVYFRNKVEEK